MRYLVSDIKGRTSCGFFEIRIPRRISGPKRDEIIRGWRKLHNEELYKCTLLKI
jgi:hypothetical protein